MNHSSKPGGGGGGGAAKSAEAEPCIPMANLNQENRAAPANTGRLTFGQKVKSHVVQNLLLFLTILGIFCGITLGFVGRYVQFSTTTKLLITFPGEMLLRVLKMLILPLIVSSLITGLAQLDPKSSGKMGLRALGFYVLTTLIATATGITLALIIGPGRNQKDTYTASSKKGPTQQLTTLDALLDIIRNMFPENIVQACSQQIGTVYKNVTKVGEGTISQTLANGTIIQVPNVTYEIVRELKFSDGSNVMGLVVFCILFGIFISYSKSEAQILYDFFFVMNELIMKIVAFIMWYSPFGILCLVAGNIIKIENMAETAQRLSIYMLTVILGLIIHSMVTVQTLYFLTTRKNPFKFLKGMLQAWLTAVGTASSSATLPITFRCLEENNKVDKRVTRFMLPLGATINMDGTALYQCVATIFIAQLNNRVLSLGQLIAICLASTATSIGVASIPSAALVTMLIVLGTVGLPTEDISYIVTVDWLLDRLRTSINVLGDAYGCGIVEQLSKEELRKLDMEAEREFVQIIAATSGGGGASGAVTAANPAVDSGFFITPVDKSNQSRSISIHDERKLSNQNLDGTLDQFNNYRAFDRRPSNRSINSYIDGQPGPATDHHHLSINQQPALTAAGSTELNQPSIVVMDAIRRRSRVLLYNSKLPGGINSMPHISHYDTGSSNPKNDSNV